MCSSLLHNCRGSHLCTLLDKLKTRNERDWYVARIIEGNWSRTTLELNIRNRLHERQGQAVTNFGTRLPAPHSELAHETLKDPYLFDFLGLGDEAHERDIENALVRHITRFLLELARGLPSSVVSTGWRWKATSSSLICSSITRA